MQETDVRPLGTVADGVADAPAGRGLPRRWPLLLLGAAVVPGLLLVVVGRSLDEPAVQAWRTVCLAVTVQALPFLLLGTALSGAINAFVPASVFQRVLPKRPALAVPVAGAAGVVLPGCECASVPVANSLIGRGVTPAAAFAFLLSAPAVNPVVLTATAVAFPGRPEMVLARLVASLVTAAAMGWLWLWLGREEWLRPRTDRPAGHVPGHSRFSEFRQGFQHDFLHAGGFLVVGAMAAATFNVAVPRAVLEPIPSVLDDFDSDTTALRSDAFGIVSQLADRLLASGRKEEAMRVLAENLRAVVLSVSVDLRVSERVLEQATAQAFKLFDWSQSKEWVEYVLELHVRAERLLRPEHFELLSSAMRLVGDKVDANLIDQYIESLCSQWSQMSDAERALFTRLAMLGVPG
jgi:hypothetical protein